MIISKYYTGNGIKGDPNNLTASSKLVNQHYQEQKREINTQITQKTDENNTLTQGFDLTLCIISGVLCPLCILGAIISQRHVNIVRNHVVPLNHHLPMAQWNMQHEINQYYGTVTMMRNAFILLAFFFGAACITCGILYKLEDDSSTSLTSQVGGLQRDLADLNSWAVTGNWTAPVAGCLNFSTHEGCAVNDTLNGTSVYDSP
ncbi:MAG: hypothetical protein PHY59_02415, partial [Methanobacterium sp.]|nr:hypothetical protein [Methanobacterium sp.]